MCAHCSADGVGGMRPGWRRVSQAARRLQEERLPGNSLSRSVTRPLRGRQEAKGRLSEAMAAQKTQKPAKATVSPTAPPQSIDVATFDHRCGWCIRQLIPLAAIWLLRLPGDTSWQNSTSASDDLPS